MYQIETELEDFTWGWIDGVPPIECPTLETALTQCIENAFYAAVPYRVIASGQPIFTVLFDDNEDDTRAFHFVIPVGAYDPAIMVFLGRFEAPAEPDFMQDSAHSEP